MKRFRLPISVDNLKKNIRFFSSIFGAQPSVLKEDYAKWISVLYGNDARAAQQPEGAMKTGVCCVPNLR